MTTTTTTIITTAPYVISGENPLFSYCFRQPLNQGTLIIWRGVDLPPPPHTIPLTDGVINIGAKYYPPYT